MTQTILSSEYSKDYFLSPQHDFHSLYAYKKFLQGKDPPEIFMQAVKQIPGINISGRFLDIGCGRGELVIYLARKGNAAVGIDYSSAAINIANQTLKNETARTRSLAKFITRDCAILPFPDNTFDYVFMLDLVEHLTPFVLNKAIKEAGRILKPGGKIIIHTNNKFYEKLVKYLVISVIDTKYFILHPRKVIRKYSNPYEYLHINYQTGKSLSEILGKYGFIYKIQYIKPATQTDLHKYLPLKPGYFRKYIYGIVWRLINSGMVKFIAPTFWVTATKNI